MKLIILLIILLCLPLVLANICEDRLDNGSDCLMVTPSIICANYTYDIFYSNGTNVVKDTSLTQLNNSIYYFNFSNQTGEYIIRLCDDTTREFRVTETYDEKFNREVGARMAIAIAIFLIGVTICLFALAMTSKSKNFQVAFTLLGFLFVVADLFFAARLVEAIYPTYTGIIHNLDAMYAVGLYTFIFLLSLASIYLLFKLFNFFKNYKQIKLEKDEEEWFQFKG